MTEPSREPTRSPANPGRAAIVNAWIELQKVGVANPSVEQLKKNTPASAHDLIETTAKILRLFSLSGERGVKRLRRWKDSHLDPEIRALAFGSTTAQQVASLLFPQEPVEPPESTESTDSASEDPPEPGEPPREQTKIPHRESDALSQDRVASIDNQALALFGQWQLQIKTERKEAAEEAAANEREIARVTLDGEQRIAKEMIERERVQARYAASQAAIKATIRTIAIAVPVSLIAGLIVGIIWRSGSGLEAPVLKPMTPPAATMAIPAISESPALPRIANVEPQASNVSATSAATHPIEEGIVPVVERVSTTSSATTGSLSP